MAILDKNVDATLVNVRLTDKGREFLAKGLKDDNNFDIVKFSFGDSEIDYRVFNLGDDSDLLNLEITNASTDAVDLKHKIYSSGVIPDGTPTVSLTNTAIQMSIHQANKTVTASTDWTPVDGNYNEEYSWKNLGPLNDYDFKLSLSVDKKVATISSYDTTGSTTVKVEGMTSGAYNLLTLTIS
jgi:hypothetical protein